MAGCTLLITGIPDPLPPSPIFLYMDKNGNPVPPPNYVPNLDDCYQGGCGCGCSGGGSATTGACGCGGATPGVPAGCDTDPGAKPLQAVNDLLRQASQEFAVTKIPGWLEAWDGTTGSFLRQFSPPTVDSLAPNPVFSYNSGTAISTQFSEFGAGFAMLFKQSVSSVGSATA